MYSSSFAAPRNPPCPLPPRCSESPLLPCQHPCPKPIIPVDSLLEASILYRLFRIHGLLVFLKSHVLSSRPSFFLQPASHSTSIDTVQKARLVNSFAGGSGGRDPKGSPPPLQACAAWAALAGVLETRHSSTEDKAVCFYHSHYNTAFSVVRRKIISLFLKARKGLRQAAAKAPSARTHHHPPSTPPLHNHRARASTSKYRAITTLSVEIYINRRQHERGTANGHLRGPLHR